MGTSATTLVLAFAAAAATAFAAPEQVHVAIATETSAAVSFFTAQACERAAARFSNDAGQLTTVEVGQMPPYRSALRLQAPPAFSSL